MKSKLLRLAIVSIAIASASSFVTSVVYGQVDKPRDIPALTYDWVDKQFDQAGKVVHETRITKAVQSDGSTVEVETNSQRDGTPREFRMIRDMSKLAQLTVRSELKTVTTFPIHLRHVDGARGQWCERDAAAIKSTMMGYEVVHNQPRIPDSAGFSIQQWVAPELGCIILEETWTRDGKVEALRQAENIRLGDPDPSLFEVPADYDELSPMQVEARAKEWFGASPVDWPCKAEQCQQNARGMREVRLRAENNYWAGQAEKQKAPTTR